MNEGIEEFLQEEAPQINGASVAQAITELEMMGQPAVPVDQSLQTTFRVPQSFVVNPDNPLTPADTLSDSDPARAREARAIMALANFQRTTNSDTYKKNIAAAKQAFPQMSEGQLQVYAANQMAKEYFKQTNAIGLLPEPILRNPDFKGVTPDDLRYFGELYRQYEGDYKKQGEFGRVYDLQMYRRHLNDLYGSKIIDNKTYNTLLGRAEAFITKEDDESVTAELAAGLIGAVKDNPAALAATAVFITLTGGTGAIPVSSAVALGVGGTFAMDDFTQTNAEIAKAAQDANPNLSQEQALYEGRVGAGLISALDVAPAGLLYRSVGKAADRVIFSRAEDFLKHRAFTKTQGLTGAARKQAMQQNISDGRHLIADEIKDTVKSLATDVADNALVGAAQGTIQQLNINVSADKSNVLENTATSAVHGAVAGAAGAAMLSTPAAGIRAGATYYRVNKAIDSLNKNVLDAVNLGTARQTDAYESNPSQAARMIDDVAPGKHFYFDALSVQERAEELGVDPSEITPAFKNLDKALNTTGVISMTPGEYLQMTEGDMGKQFADLRSADASTMSSQTAQDVLRPQDEAGQLSNADMENLPQNIAAEREVMQAQQDALGAELDSIRNDVFSKMRENTSVPPQQIDALSNSFSSFFQAMGEITGTSPFELYSKYSGAFHSKEHRLNLSKVVDIDDMPEVLGAYNPDDKGITYGRSADFSTALHEVSHFFLDTMVRLQAENPTNNQLSRAVGYLEKYLDMKSGDLHRAAVQGGAWSDLIPEEKADSALRRKYTQAQEDFVYSFLSYVISGKSPNADLKPLFDDMKKMLRLSEVKRQQNLYREQGANKDYSALVEQDYADRFGKPLTKFNYKLDYFIKRMFQNETAFKAIDDEYPIDDPFAVFNSKIVTDTPETSAAYTQLRQEVETSREAVQSLIDKNLADDVGVIVSTDKKVQAKLKKMLEQTPEGRQLVKDFLSTNKGAPSIYRDEFAKALRQTGSDKLSKIRDLVDTYKVSIDEVNNLVKLSIFTKSQANSLINKGYAVPDGGANIAFLSGLLKGWDEYSAPKAGASQFRQGIDWLRMLAEAPDRYDVARVKAIQRTIAAVKGGQKYFSGRSNALRGEVINAHRRILTAADKYIKQLTKTAVDDGALINAIADDLINDVRFRDLNDRHFSTLARRAQTEGARYIKKMDYPRAARAIRTERVNIELADKALHFKQSILKQAKTQQGIMSRFARNDKALAKTYDFNYLLLAQHLMGNLGLARKVDTERLARLMHTDGQLEELYQKAGTLATQPRYYGSMTVGELTDALNLVQETIQAARNQRSMIVEGRNLSADEVATRVAQQFTYRKDKDGALTDKEYDDVVYDRNVNISARENIEGVAGEGVSFSGTAIEKNKRSLLRSLRFNLARVSTELYARDGKLRGFLHQAIYQPIRDATTKTKLEQIKLTNELNEIFNSHEWKQGVVIADSLRDENGNAYVFGANGSYNGSGQMELLGMLLHLGNDSNTQKLTGGYGWKISDMQKFLQHCIDNDIIDEDLLDMAQRLWDLYDREFQLAQDAFYERHGYRMREVPKRPILFTLKDGRQKRLRGGYAPAKTNADMAAIRVNDFKDFEDIEKGTFLQSFPTMPTGWTKSRNEAYRQPLELNPLNLSRQVLQVSAYAHMMPVIEQVNNIFKKQTVRDTLARKDPHFYEDMIKPFLVAAARNNVAQALEDPFTGRIVSALVRGVGRGIMFANFSNALQQVTGVASAATLVKPKFLAQSLAEVGAHYSERFNFLADNSDYMRLRLQENQSTIEEIMRDVCLKPSSQHGIAKGKAYAKTANDWAASHAYFAQKFMQNRIDVIVANAAYKQAIFEGKSHVDAVRDAEEVVRQTQSSFDTIDVSHIENQSPFVRAIFQFCNYFYTMMNLQVAELRRVLQVEGTNTLERTARLMTFFMMGVYIPSIVADAIAKTAGGEWWNDEDTPHKLMVDNLLGAPLRSLTSAIPGASSIFNKYWNSSVLERYYFTENFNIPVYTTLQNLLTSTGNVVDPETEITTRDIRNIGAALGVMFPILAPIARFGSYQLDVGMGNVEPTSWADYVRGTLTGKASADSKN